MKDVGFMIYKFGWIFFYKFCIKIEKNYEKKNKKS
jgi:hypothetical protein